MKKIILQISGDEINIHKASRFHGWLMDQLEGEYAEKLHDEQMRPFSQYLFKNNGEWEWHIQTLTDEAGEVLGECLLNTNLREIYLNDQKECIQIILIQKECEETTIDDLLKKTYFQDSPRICKVKFLTPVSFKRQGKYLIFPEIKLIFQNLLNRFQSCDYQVSLGGEELLAEIMEKVEIVDYNLQTRRFCLEGTGVKGFQGEIVLKIHGSQMLANLVNFLLRFGEFSGCGIKTALGMGAMEFIERR